MWIRIKKEPNLSSTLVYNVQFHGLIRLLEMKDKRKREISYIVRSSLGLETTYNLIADTFQSKFCFFSNSENHNLSFILDITTVCTPLNPNRSLGEHLKKSQNNSICFAFGCDFPISNLQ